MSKFGKLEGKYAREIFAEVAVNLRVLNGEIEVILDGERHHLVIITRKKGGFWRIDSSIACFVLLLVEGTLEPPNSHYSLIEDVYFAVHVEVHPWVVLFVPDFS